LQEVCLRWPKEQEVAGAEGAPQGVLEAAELGHSTKEQGDKGRKEGEGNESRGVKGNWIGPFSTPRPQV